MTKATDTQRAAFAAVLMIASIAAVGLALLFVCEMALRQLGGA